MDQNRIPSSSPLQHHNESCGRPTSSSSSDPNAPRPSSSHQNPPGQPGWKQDHSSETTGTIPWVANASGGHWDDDQVGIGQGVASSSRLPPSTQFYPTPVSLATVDSPIPSPQEYIEAPGSALLTSEPLDRSSSTMPSPNLSGPSTVPAPLGIISGRKSTGKRRARASSLPTADPIFKRRRFAADIPTPSEEWARTFATRRKDPTKLSVQQARARDLGARLLNGRQLRGGCPPGLQILVASHQPLINLRTLKSLDAHEILKQPQLRHDLLFDTLAFRPMNATAITYSDTLTAGADPNYAAAISADHRGVCISTDMYWESIAVEIATGCRCTRWQVPIGLTLGLQSIKGKERMFECICGAWKKEMTEDQWWAFQKSRMWPSRLPPLIKTLREILISLMGSTTPCPNHFAHSFSREALDLHELTCPTVTHALVPQLYEALDPDFLTRRVRRGAFDLSLFEMLGEAMKVHCAPIRDGLIDEMVRIATSGSVGKGSVALGLRRCFDCVEIMKLDIANHQVHALRPYLWSCATNYELSTFNTFLSSSSTPILSSSTRQWVRSASLRVLGRTTPKKRLHLLGQCPCRLGDNTELVIKSAADGFIDLIFGVQKQELKADKVDTGVILEGVWMPSFNAPKWRVEALPEQVPESLRMDIRRIGAFHTEAVELTVLHLLTLVTRNLLSVSHPDLTPRLIKTHLKRITHDLGPLLITHPIFPPSHPVPSTHSDPELSLHLASRILRLEAADQFPYTPEEHRKLDHLTRTISGFIKSQICTEGQLFRKCWERMGEVVRMMLEHEMMKSENVGVGGECIGQAGRVSELLPEEEEEEEGVDERNQILVPATPEPQDFELPIEPEIASTLGLGLGPGPAAIRSTVTSAEQRERRGYQHEQEKTLIKHYGLDTIYTELKAFVKRMDRIAGFNVSVFKGVYGDSGMVVGA